MEKFNILLEYGQSYWLDYLSRDMITDGTLKNRIEKEGLRGITSNPSIFFKAISNSKLYDEQIEKLSDQGKNTEEIYETLVIKDIQDACDLLKPVYESSNGQDGFVSLEVSPLLARDTEGTKQEARKLFAKVDRANSFIKIPGTIEGIPAIEEMLYEGININVTLLFSIERYQQVAEAYIRALQRRYDDGKPVDKIASVASFFLSRIDVMTDQLLKERIVPNLAGTKKIMAENLLGETAIASAKIAYSRYKALFSGKNWTQLTSKGARAQRLLWASTSNKTKGYRDTRYVEPLIGLNTVNTMPEETIEAFKEQGKLVQNTIEKDLNSALTVFLELEQSGINLQKISDNLVNEGIDKFIKPYGRLMEAIESKLTHA